MGDEQTAAGGRPVIPELNTDFIYAALAQELGLIGEVVPDGTALHRAREVAAAISARATASPPPPTSCTALTSRSSPAQIAPTSATTKSIVRLSAS